MDSLTTLKELERCGERLKKVVARMKRERRMQKLPPGVKPEDYTVDKSTFPDGPWKQEPDRVDFETCGFPGLIIRVGHTGHLCGYVGVPPGHPWHGKDTGDIDARVHGGITYAEQCAGYVCHTPKPGEPEHLWWVGFDCSHSGDLSPGYKPYTPGYRRDETYKDIEYVKGQIRQLAKQAKQARVLAAK